MDNRFVCTFIFWALCEAWRANNFEKRLARLRQAACVMHCLCWFSSPKNEGMNMLSASISYQFIARDIDASLQRTSEQPVVARESEYYLSKIGEINSVDEFLADDRVYSFAMRAMGLEEMTYAKAFMRKVLTEGVDDNSSFANQLADKRYADFAENFNFKRYGDTATTFTKARQGTVDKFVRQVLEEDAGANNEGVRLALYFKRKAPNITSAVELLAETALLKVVETMFNMNLSSGNIDKNISRIEKQLDVADLKDPEKLDKLLIRFTSMWELNEPTANSTSNVGLLFSQPIEAGINQDLLSSLQSLKLNGR